MNIQKLTRKAERLRKEGKYKSSYCVLHQIKKLSKPKREDSGKRRLHPMIF